MLLGLLLITGLAAGSYPALSLAGVRPVVTLRDRANLGGMNRLTRTLATAQFTLSVFLIACTLVMARQLDYLKTRHLGYQGEQVVVIPTRGIDGEEVLSRYQALAAEYPDLVSVSGSNLAIGQSLWRRGFDYEGELKQVAVFRITDDFFETLQMDLLQGRSFDGRRADDTTAAIIVNEAFARDFGWREPVGQVLPVDWGGLKNPTVVGLVKDFHFTSLQNEVAPAVLYTSPIDPVLNVYVRIRPDNVPVTLDRLRDAWASLTHEVPFTYSFLDDTMDRLYQSEERWSRIVGYGALFAVLIACLGLFGMAMLAAVQRTKEIGIRKVLGASAASVAALLTKDFVRLVLLAVLLATPLAYFAMWRWLQDYATRIDLSVDTFLLAGGLVLIVSILTVSYHAIRTALADPVKSLRYE